MITRHVGVGWLPPRSNDIFNVTAVPETDPEMLPSLTLWHDVQDPSVRLRGRMLTDPDSALPVCVRTHVNVSGPSPSDPLPVHVPARFSEDAVGGDGVLATGEGAAVDAGLPAQASNRQPAATPAMMTARQPAAPLNGITNSMIRPK